MAANAGAIRAGKAFVEFFLDDAALRKGLAKLEKRFDAIGGKLRSVGKIFLGAGSAMAAGFLVPIKAASDLEETMNKFNVVFGDNAGAVKAWGDDFASTIGRSEKQVAEFLGNSQDLFVPLGFEPGAATELSKQVTGLAFDLASFNNIADDDAIRDLHAALTGSGEVMKKYGVIVSEAAIKQELLNQGIDAKTVTEQQKVQARLNIIMRGTTAAQGDALRSAGGFANQVKGLWGVLTDTAATIGNAVLPMITAFVSIVREQVRVIAEWIEANPQLIQGIAIAAGVITALGAVLFAAGVGLQVLSFAAAGLGMAIGPVVAVVGFLVSPLGLIIALGAGLVTAFATMTETGQAMTAQLGGWFAELWAIASTTFEAISAALAAGDIQAAAAVLWSALNLLWLQGTQGLREAWHNAIGSIVKIWHTAWAGIASIGTTVWGNLERGWSHTVQFFADVWDMTVAALKTGLNELVGWFKKAWAYVTGASAAEFAKIDAEIDAKNAKISNDMLGSIGDRDKAATADRLGSANAQSAVLDQIGADLAAKLGAADDGTKEKIDAAQSRLEEARAAWGDANAAALAAGDATKVQEKKAAAVGGAIAANAGGAAGKVTSSGSFSADAAALMIRGGGSVDEKILKVEEETLATLNRIERKSGAGALKAGP